MVANRPKCCLWAVLLHVKRMARLGLFVILLLLGKCLWFSSNLNVVDDFFLNPGVLGVVIPNTGIAHFGRQNFGFLFIIFWAAVFFFTLFYFLLLPFLIFSTTLWYVGVNGCGCHQTLKAIHSLPEM